MLCTLELGLTQRWLSLQGETAAKAADRNSTGNRLQCGSSQHTAVRLRDVVQLPDGAKVLTAGDRSIVIAPLGHLVEEHYTVYLRFTKQAQAALA